MTGARPLHERGDVFAAIAAAAEHKTSPVYDPNVVEAKFRGALMMLCGTVIQRGHDTLAKSIAQCAMRLELGNDPSVAEALEWIKGEKARHTPIAS